MLSSWSQPGKMWWLLFHSITSLCMQNFLPLHDFLLCREGGSHLVNTNNSGIFSHSLTSFHLHLQQQSSKKKNFFFIIPPTKSHWWVQRMRAFWSSQTWSWYVCSYFQVRFGLVFCSRKTLCNWLCVRSSMGLEDFGMGLWPATPDWQTLYE